MCNLIAFSGVRKGLSFPDGDVVVMSGKSRKVVKMSTQLSDKDVVLFIPGAFTKASEEMLSSFNTDKWRESGFKVHCISNDIINVLESWKDYFVDLRINMISNAKKTIGSELLFECSTLGTVFKRVSVVVENKIVNEVNIEENIYDLDVSSGDSTFKQIKI